MQGSSAKFPIDVTTNGIFIPVEVMDSAEELHFALDFRVSASHLDTQVAKRLALKPFGEGTVQGAGAGRVRVQRVRNVGLKVRDRGASH